MPNPANQNNEGLVFGGAGLTLNFPSGVATNTNSYQPTNGQTGLKFAINSTVNGTYQGFSVDELGNQQAESGVLPVTGGTEARLDIVNPMKRAYFIQLNQSTGSAGTAYVAVYGSGAQQ